MSKIFVERIDEEHLDFNEDHLTCYKGKPFTGVGYVSFENDLGLEFETSYQDGHEHGLKRKWYSQSKLEYELHMLRGMGHGIQKFWHPNAQLKELINAEYGITLNRKTWDEKGILIDQFELQEGTTNHRLLIRFRELYKDLKP